MRRKALSVARPTLTESAMNTSPAASHAATSPLIKRSDTLRNLAEVLGRVLLGVLFLVAGVGKLGAYKATAAFMASAGVPGALLPAVIAAELLGSLAIIVGWKARVAAFLLAGFSVLTALTFHNN